MTIFDKVFDRLSDAEDAYQALLDDATDRMMYQRKWGTFVLAVGSTFSSLEQAIKPFPKAKAWHDGIKNLRKTDPLLKWMQEARNAEEHQSGRSTKFVETKINIPKATLADSDSKKRVEPLTKQTYDASGRPVLQLDVRFYLLADVRNRTGRVYPPPKEHLGSRIEGNSPNEIGRLQLEYLRDIVQAGTKYVK